MHGSICQSVAARLRLSGCLGERGEPNQSLLRTNHCARAGAWESDRSMFSLPTVQLRFRV
jgi:hypothetical protein